MRDDGNYLLIDGAFFERLCLHYSDIIGESVIDLINWDAISLNRFRVIYYDALPVKKTAESEKEFSEKLNRKVSFLEAIRRRAKFQVRDGRIRLREKGRGRNTGEFLQQKGVDTWIAVDAIRIAMDGRARSIEVWTSDLDLYPVFESLHETNARGTLRYQVGRTADELIFAADVAEPLSLSFLCTHLIGIRRLYRFQLSRGAYGSRDHMISAESGLRPIKTFNLGSKEFELFYNDAVDTWSLCYLERGSYEYWQSKELFSVAEAGLSIGLRGIMAEIDTIRATARGY